MLETFIVLNVETLTFNKEEQLPNIKHILVTSCVLKDDKSSDVNEEQ